MDCTWRAHSRPHISGLAVLALTVSALLAGCGGGGSNDGLPSSTSATQSIEVSPINISCSPTSMDGGDLTADLERPQCGSTAHLGKAGEGFYQQREPTEILAVLSRLSDSMELFYIDPLGGPLGGTDTRAVYGPISIAGQSWAFNSTAVGAVDGSSPNRTESAAGTGSFVDRRSLQAKVSRMGKPDKSWESVGYLSSNALAVSQGSLAGKWVADDGDLITFEIDANGNMTGQEVSNGELICGVSGSIVMAEPATAKNMYRAKFGGERNPSTSANCDSAFEGWATLVVEPGRKDGKKVVGLWIAGHTSDGKLYWDYLEKQK